MAAKDSFGKRKDFLSMFEGKSRKECLKIFKDFLEKGNESIRLKPLLPEEILANGDEEIELKNIIIQSTSEIKIKEKKNVRFRECVFIGDLSIDQAAENIDLVDCFVFGCLFVKGSVLSGKSCLFVNHSQIDSLYVMGTFSSLIMILTSVGVLKFMLADVAIPYFFHCFIQSVLMNASRVKLKYKQGVELGVKNSLLGKDNQKWKNVPLLENLRNDEIQEYSFWTIEKNASDFANCEKLFYNIFDFIEKGEFCRSVNDRACLVYYRDMRGLGKKQKFWYKFWGGLIKPRVILFWFFIILLLCTVIYLFAIDAPFFVKCAENGIDSICEKRSFGETLYFSIITITTVGYGDITPCGYARILASIEGILGILMGGAFLLAVTRKYFSK